MRGAAFCTGVYGILAVAPLYARSFAGMSPEELERMGRESFHLDRCRERAGLVEVLRKAIAA